MKNMETKITIIPMAKYEQGARATVHSTGKLGFNKKAQGMLGIQRGGYIELGSLVNSITDTLTGNTTLYARVSTTKTIHSLPIIKAGEYYYLNMKAYYDNIGVGYKKIKIIYDIHATHIGDEQWYKLEPRVINRKTNN